MPPATLRGLDLGQAPGERQKDEGPLAGPSARASQEEEEETRRRDAAVSAAQAAFLRVASRAALVAALMLASVSSLACLATLLKLS